MKAFSEAVGLVVISFILIIGVTFIGAFITRWAWNTFMPYMFDLKEISYWQALAFSFLLSSFRGFTSTVNKKQ